VCIRSVFSTKVMEMRKNLNNEILNTEEELNQIEELKIEKIRILVGNDNTSNMEKIDVAITTIKNKLQAQRQKLTDSLKFISKAKWFEYGEKSNKFFLNLNKSRQKQKLISTIRNEDKEMSGQKDVMKCIKEFFQDLYSKKITINPQNDEFYANCPKFDEKNERYMEESLTLCDMKKALMTCKDSAPGPDGIPYSVYKRFWKITGPIILDAWNYSLLMGKLPASHAESVITLLPKEGKDRREIKNWRPITLSNCDSKIVTKALSIKMSKILSTIIDPSQTAYVPGRAVADNLRTNFFLKRYCRQKNINSVLISLDAKKAFDSVDHEYIKRTLIAYGFGPEFIRTFQVLYTDITARVLVNGFTSESLQIKRGVKQGDALSCAIFIICIDPLLRNLNGNAGITNIRVEKSQNFMFKAAAYADEISIICKNNTKCIQQVFNEYERLTKHSGLELNADKTEILF